MKALPTVILAGILFASHAFAQTFNASLGGTVTDSSGAVIPKATVTATGIETGVATKTVTNTSGVYEFPSLQEGNYRVSAEMGGFKQFVYEMSRWTWARRLGSTLRSKWAPPHSHRGDRGRGISAADHQRGGGRHRHGRSNFAPSPD